MKIGEVGGEGQENTGTILAWGSTGAYRKEEKENVFIGGVYLY